MPAALSYPGVYIEEIESGVHTITGVATSIAAFVGRTLRGPVNEPVMVSGYGEFERIFGGRWAESYLAYAVRDFFQNGGAQAVIVRLFNSGIADGTTQDSAEAAAKAAAKAASDDVAAEAAGGETDPKKVAAAASKQKASFAPGTAEREAFDVVVAKAKAKADAGGTVAQVVTAASAAVDAAASGAVPETYARIKIKLEDNSSWWLEAAYPGSWGNGLRVRIDHDLEKDANGNTDPKLFNLTVRDDATGATELFRNVSIDANASRPIDKVLETGSALLRARNGVPTARPKMHDKYPGLDPWGDDPVPSSPIVPTPAPPWNAKVADEAGDGELLNADSFTGSGLEGKKEGLYALEKVDLFNLLCIPPHARGGNPIEKALVNDATKYCEKRRAMMLVDPDPAWEAAPDKIQATLDRVEAGDVGNPSRNAALFFPRLVEADPERDGREEYFPPCGAVAGVFARTDANRGVWKAPAGLDASLSSAARISVPLTDLENGRLNPRGINCLRLMPGAGPVVWGARTRKGDDRTPDDYKYIPVRRLALFIEESLYRGTHWVVFEPNDEPLWASIRLNVGAFMQRLFRQGAFQGSAPRDAYFVKCDKDTTTQADIDLGVVNIIVGFAPLKPAEFVVITLQQMAGNIPT